ncbi:MAG: AbrB/MazE/SpoVT family DNA-binding domain-containing protein [Bryobacteraceae bacterium]
MSVPHTQTSKVGKRGAIVVPAPLRRRFGMEEGSLIIAEERDDGILIRPAMAVPIETYSPERKAEFLLSNAVDAADYREARREVQRLGLNPDEIPHRRPE